MFVARVVRLQCLEQYRVEVFPVRQLTLVELLQSAAFNLSGHEVVGREHHVVAGFAGHQLAIEGLVAVIDVVGEADAGFFLEIFRGVWRDVIRPVVDLDGFGGLADRCNQHQRGQSQCLSEHESIPVGFFCWQAIKGSAFKFQRIEYSENQNVGLAHGFLDVPDAEAVGRQHQCVADVYVQGLATVRGEGAAALDEVTEFLGDDLPPPASRGAFPDAGLDTVIAFDAGGRSHGHRSTQGHGDRIGFVQFQGCGVLELRDAHGNTCRCRSAFSA
ncbi:hypothetical protein D3C78_1162230 [compost metagenome]